MRVRTTYALVVLEFYLRVRVDDLAVVAVAAMSSHCLQSSRPQNQSARGTLSRPAQARWKTLSQPLPAPSPHITDESSGTGRCTSQAPHLQRGQNQGSSGGVLPRG